MTLRESLQAATAQLSAGPHPDRARLDAEALLLHVARLNRAALFARWEENVNAEDAAQYAALISRRLAGEPIQYITGECEFYGLPFRVTPAVLIPRPETEHLVEAALKILGAPEPALSLSKGLDSETWESYEPSGAPSMESAPSGQHGWETTNPNSPSPTQPQPSGAPSMESAASGRHGWETTSSSMPGAPGLEETWEGRILDIGTGSGAIAIALAHHLPHARITAIDLSADALRIAEENASRNHVSVRFLQGDLLAPVIGEHFDLIVSNPPYVPATDHDTLSVEVREHEPHLALFADDDGLEVYRSLIPAAFHSLAPGGFIALEIGYGQSNDVQALLAAAGFQRIHITPDLQGIPRVLTVQRP